MPYRVYGNSRLVAGTGSVVVNSDGTISIVGNTDITGDMLLTGDLNVGGTAGPTPLFGNILVYIRGTGSGAGSVGEIILASGDVTLAAAQTVGAIGFQGNDSSNPLEYAGIACRAIGTSGLLELQFYAKSGAYVTATAPDMTIMNEGDVRIGDGNAIATNATSGFLLIPGCAGAPTGDPGNDSVGAVALVYDTTNNLLYANDAGGWVAVNSP